jgi:hypothetical protein
MGSSWSNMKLANILQVRSDKIIINDNNITINNILYHFYPDIKEKCLKILKEEQINSCIIEFPYYEKTIYGLRIDSLFFYRMCISEVLSRDTGKYYLDEKII